MKRLQLLSLHLRTIYNFPDYAKIIKDQASKSTFEVRKDNVKVYNNGYKPNRRKYVSLPRDDCKAKTLRK